ncbi:cytochrome b5-like [Culicoides brevitarsis]|uniref:cytochrome b5-like n=1 Tax=Culicoides brevitarsis TaxID=469753 RepID=UPI00307C0715
MSETEKKQPEPEMKTSATTTPTKSTTETKTIDAAEVKEHNKKDDIWIILRDKTTKVDKVYDVTKFLEEHPGGREVLLEVAGKDATQDFEDVGHSSAADELMKKFYIGDLTPSTEAKNDETVDAENVPVAFTSCFKSFSAFKSKFGFK